MFRQLKESVTNQRYKRAFCRTPDDWRFYNINHLAPVATELRIKGEIVS
jgi:hypothetical protein